MICETHKSSYPYILNDKSAKSTENAEHKKEDSLFNCLKLSSLFKSKLFLVIFPFQTANILD